MPCIVDVRNENEIRQAVEKAVAKFGGIDIVVNNASAINLTDVGSQDMKRYDLMQNINARGTFLVSKECLPYLKQSSHPHILNLSPPIIMEPHWFSGNVAYTIAKYGMSMCALGMSEEFKPFGIGVNTLWPVKIVQTAATDMLRGTESAKYARSTDIMAEAAYAILCRSPRACTGNFFTDEQVLRQEGVTDFKHYALFPEFNDQLVDCFLNEDAATPSPNVNQAKL